jgi:hypothetical protein
MSELCAVTSGLTDLEERYDLTGQETDSAALAVRAVLLLLLLPLLMIDSQRQQA